MLGDYAVAHGGSAARAAKQRIVWYLAIVICFAGAAVLCYYALRVREESFLQSPPSPARTERGAPGALAPAARPPPSPGAQQAPISDSLPPLTESDRLLREAIVDGLGGEGVRLLRESDLVRRLVATVDSLPRAQVPAGMLPFKPLGDAFLVEHTVNGMFVSAANFRRYRPYVMLITALDPKAIATVYVRYYAWFQETYRMLGYPTGEFRQRLLEAIDDLLDAPDPDGPVEIVQPKVLYEFADPELEGLSAGQKMMIRMGPENRRVLIAELREIRRELVDRSELR